MNLILLEISRPYHYQSSINQLLGLEIMDGSSPDINVKAETINQSPMNNALGDIVTIPPQGDYMLILSMIYRNNNKNIKASTFVIERSYSDYKVVLSVEQ